jgi:hypothetical protein
MNSDANRKSLQDAAESKTLSMRGNSMHGNRETLETSASQDAGRFEKAGDYQAFERVLQETLQLAPMRVCSYCLNAQPLAFALVAGTGRRFGRFLPRSPAHDGFSRSTATSYLSVCRWQGS